MNDKNRETLVILQEECAEVIVEVSKVRRFGLDSIHYKDNVTHNEKLEIEVGDVLAMVDILLDQGILQIRNEGAKNRYRVRSIPLETSEVVWSIQRLVERANQLGSNGFHHYLFPINNGRAKTR